MPVLPAGTSPSGCASRSRATTSAATKTATSAQPSSNPEDGRATQRPPECLQLRERKPRLAPVRKHGHSRPPESAARLGSGLTCPFAGRRRLSPRELPGRLGEWTDAVLLEHGGECLQRLAPVFGVVSSGAPIDQGERTLER